MNTKLTRIDWQLPVSVLVNLIRQGYMYVVVMQLAYFDCNLQNCQEAYELEANSAMNQIGEEIASVSDKTSGHHENSRENCKFEHSLEVNLK